MEGGNFPAKFASPCPPAPPSLIIKSARLGDEWVRTRLFAHSVKEWKAVSVSIIVSSLALVITFRQVPDRLWVIANCDNQSPFSYLFFLDLWVTTGKKEEQ